MRSSYRFGSALAIMACVATLSVACGDGGEATASDPSETTIAADGEVGTAELTPVDGMNADGAGTVPGGVSDDDVVGGQAIEIEEVPWTVALVHPGESDNFCGGVLIAPTRVLTAAHCTQYVKRDSQTGKPIPGTEFVYGPAYINVVAGRTDLDDDTGQEVAVTMVWQHPDYDNEFFSNDYAFLDLAEPLNQTAIAVPPNTATGLWGNNVLVDVAGWGCQLSNKASQPECEPGGSPLMTSTFLAKDATWCREDYGSIDSTTELCLQNQSDDSTSCNGDSGGPYTVEEETTHVKYVVALVSYGKRGCPHGVPVVGALLAPILDGRGEISSGILWTTCKGDPEPAQRCDYAA